MLINGVNAILGVQNFWVSMATPWTQNIVFGALSVASELENIVMALPDRSPYTAVGFMGLRSDRGIPCSRRGVISYLVHLHLLEYDFKGKKVLDVGSGRSRFAQIIDATYRSSGTRAIPVDLLVKPKSAIGMRADAVSLPFETGTFDLITNHWVFQHYLSTSIGGFMLEEMMRVCKTDGQIRISFAQDEPLENFIVTLEQHPSVEEVVRHSGVMGTQCVEIHLRENKKAPSMEKLADFYEDMEKRGRVDVPWRLDVLAHHSSRAKVIALRSGSHVDRLEYIAHVRRFLNHDFDVDPEYPEVLAAWFANSQDDFELRKNIISFFVERDEVYHRFSHAREELYPFFERAWLQLSDLEKNNLMEYWLSNPFYRRLLKLHPKKYLQVTGEFSPAVAALRDQLEKELEREKAAKEAQLEAALRFSSNSKMMF